VIEVRAAEAVDVAAVAGLLEEMDRFYGSVDFPPIGLRERQIEGLLFGPVPAARVLLAFDGTDLVGLATYSSSAGAPGGEDRLYGGDHLPCLRVVAGRWYVGQGLGDLVGLVVPVLVGCAVVVARGGSPFGDPAPDLRRCRANFRGVAGGCAVLVTGRLVDVVGVHGHELIVQACYPCPVIRGVMTFLIRLVDSASTWDGGPGWRLIDVWLRLIG